MMFFILGCLFIIVGTTADPSIITFPASFNTAEQEDVDPFDVKAHYQMGIDAVQSVAGLVHDLLLQESINFAAKNWIVSPVSLAGVFAQLLMGSRGEIRQILSTALSMSDYDYRDDFKKFEVHRQLGSLMKYLHHTRRKDYDLLLSAVVFLQSGLHLKTTYRHALVDFYNTHILPVDFSGSTSESMKKINEWVKTSTLGRFSDLLPVPLPPNTASLMANIVYFKGAWEVPFDPDYTQPGWFFINQTNKVQVDYMFGEQEVLYGNTSDYQLIGLPFKGKQVVIYILLPNGKFSTRVALKQFDTMASNARVENVTLVLPKVKLSSTISVKDAIGRYLIRKPGHSRRKFKSPKAVKNFTMLTTLEKFANLPLPLSIQSMPTGNSFDMAGASDDLRFKVDDILHKVSLELDEVGTEIVAMTSTLIDHSGNDFILTVNRPFLFFIRHEITKVHLFWGLIANPNKKTKPLIKATTPTPQGNI